MSSHHFVREEQATALYIFGRNIDESVLMQLLEWNPTILANEDVIDWLFSLNIKIDIVLSKEEIPIELPYDFIVWKPSSLESELQRIDREVKASRVIVLGSCEVASVHQMMFKYPERQLALFENDRKHFLLKAGASFRKWVNSGFVFDLIENGPTTIEGSIIKEKNGYCTTEDGIVTINSLSNLIIIETL
ncbi:MAG: hypothetical protein R2730_16155 [Chitinophagales bacterium]